MTRSIDNRASHTRYKSNHIIEDISYAKDYVLCICGWEGKVDDLRPHQLASPKLGGKEYENKWKRLYGNRLKEKGYTPIKEASMLGD